MAKLLLKIEFVVLGPDIILSGERRIRNHVIGSSLLSGLQLSINTTEPSHMTAL